MYGLLPSKTDLSSVRILSDSVESWKVYYNKKYETDPFITCHDFSNILSTVMFVSGKDVTTLNSLCLSISEQDFITQPKNSASQHYLSFPSFLSLVAHSLAPTNPSKTSIVTNKILELHANFLKFTENAPGDAKWDQFVDNLEKIVFLPKSSASLLRKSIKRQDFDEIEFLFLNVEYILDSFSNNQNNGKSEIFDDLTNKQITIHEETKIQLLILRFQSISEKKDITKQFEKDKTKSKSKIIEIINQISGYNVIINWIDIKKETKVVEVCVIIRLEQPVISVAIDEKNRIDKELKSDVSMKKFMQVFKNSKLDFIESSILDSSSLRPPKYLKIGINILGDVNKGIAFSNGIEPNKIYDIWIDPSTHETKIKFESFDETQISVDTFIVPPEDSSSQLIILEKEKKIEIEFFSLNHVNKMKFYLFLKRPPSIYLSDLNIIDGSLDYSFNPTNSVVKISSNLDEIKLVPKVVGEAFVYSKKFGNVKTGENSKPIQRNGATKTQFRLSVKNDQKTFDTYEVEISWKPKESITTDLSTPLLSSLSATNTIKEQPKFNPIEAKSVPYHIYLNSGETSTKITLTSSSADTILRIDGTQINSNSESNSLTSGNYIISAIKGKIIEKYSISVTGEGSDIIKEISDSKKNNPVNGVSKISFTNARPFTEDIDTRKTSDESVQRIVLEEGYKSTEIIVQLVSGATAKHGNEKLENGKKSKTITIQEKEVVTIEVSYKDIKTFYTVEIVAFSDVIALSDMSNAIRLFAKLTEDVNTCQDSLIPKLSFKDFVKRSKISEEDSELLFEALDFDNSKDIEFFEFFTGVTSGIFTSNPDFTKSVDGTKIEQAKKEYLLFSRQDISLQQFLKMRFDILDSEALILSKQIHSNTRQQLSRVHFLRAFLIDLYPCCIDYSQLNYILSAIGIFSKFQATQVIPVKTLFGYLQSPIGLTSQHASFLSHGAEIIGGIHSLNPYPYTIDLRSLILSINLNIIPSHDETKKSEKTAKISRFVDFVSSIDREYDDLKGGGPTGFTCDNLVNVLFEKKKIDKNFARVIGSAIDFNRDGLIKKSEILLLVAHKMVKSISVPKEDLAPAAKLGLFSRIKSRLGIGMKKEENKKEEKKKEKNEKVETRTDESKKTTKKEVSKSNETNESIIAENPTKQTQTTNVIPAISILTPPPYSYLNPTFSGQLNNQPSINKQKPPMKHHRSSDAGNQALKPLATDCKNGECRQPQVNS
eukprot:c21200_g1_i4.p1 GENE.c21200_g1_i4~~c21200_g1_i4.p1  ORF type:complete len:1223 (+),score=453.00 c21200_g1_i4:57-3725(+)